MWHSYPSILVTCTNSLNKVLVKADIIYAFVHNAKSYPLCCENGDWKYIMRYCNMSPTSAPIKIPPLHLVSPLIHNCVLTLFFYPCYYAQSLFWRHQEDFSKIIHFIFVPLSPSLAVYLSIPLSFLSSLMLHSRNILFTSLIQTICIIWK